MIKIGAVKYNSELLSYSTIQQRWNTFLTREFLGNSSDSSHGVNFIEDSSVSALNGLVFWRKKVKASMLHKNKCSAPPQRECLKPVCYRRVLGKIIVLEILSTSLLDSDLPNELIIQSTLGIYFRVRVLSSSTVFLETCPKPYAILDWWLHWSTVLRWRTASSHPRTQKNVNRVSLSSFFPLGKRKKFDGVPTPCHPVSAITHWNRSLRGFSPTFWKCRSVLIGNKNFIIPCIIEGKCQVIWEKNNLHLFHWRKIWVSRRTPSTHSSMAGLALRASPPPGLFMIGLCHPSKTGETGKVPTQSVLLHPVYCWCL